MGLLIPITGVGADWRVPGAYAEILPAQGPSGAGIPAREVVLVMPMLSTGTWTVNTLYPIYDAGVAETGAGAGSPMHRAARMFRMANKTSKLWGLPLAETSGGSPVAATATVTFTTNATAVGTAVVTIAGEECSFTFKANDTVTTIAAGIVAAINAKTWLPVTANNAAGVITVTAKLKGISQGTATVSVIRIRATITSGIGTTVATSGAFLGTGAAGTDGSTTEAANLATALAIITNLRKYYVVSSSNDATSYTNLLTHITSKSAPRSGLRSHGVVAYMGTLAATQTLATARNNWRLQLGWQKNGESDCAELAANLAAILQKREAVDTAFNFNGYSGGTDADWLVKPAFDPADWPTPDDQNDAINSGITTIASSDAKSYIVMSCSTQSKNSTGTVNDFRATQTKQRSVTDEFVDEEIRDWSLQHATKKLRDDEKLVNGQINPNQRLRRDVLQPSQLIGGIKKRMDDFYDAGKLQDLDASKNSIRAFKTGSRVEVGYDLHTIDWADQMTQRVAEVSTG